MGEKKPTKLFCKRTLDLSPKEGKKDTVISSKKNDDQLEIIFDIFPENYLEQDMWPYDPPQGSWTPSYPSMTTFIKAETNGFNYLVENTNGY